MSFGKKEMAIHIVLSASMLVVGAVATFLTRGDHDPDGFWYGYLLGANGAGIMAMVVGVVWLALAVSQRYLNMFSVDRRMGAEALLIVLAVIGLVSGVMIYMLVTGLPASDVAELSRQMEPDSVKKIVAMESNLKGFVAGALIVFGIWLAAVPCVRCFKDSL